MLSINSRRQFIRAALGLLGIAVAGCRSDGASSAAEAPTAGPQSCDDLSGLTEAEIQLRVTFGYVKASPAPENQCNNCNLWIPNEADPSCGKCLLFKGPVYAAGHCTSWAPQT